MEVFPTMLRAALTALIAFGLVACGKPPSAVSLAFSSYESTPVVVTKFSLNGSELGLLPVVVDGRADTMRPSEGASRMDMPVGSGSGSSLSLKAEWTELTTGHAWQGAVSVPVDKLATTNQGRVEMMPVFGPDGLLIVTSDPLPQGEQGGQTVDVAQVCGTALSGGVDYRSDPGALPQLREVLGAARSPAAANACSAK